MTEAYIREYLLLLALMAALTVELLVMATAVVLRKCHLRWQPHGLPPAKDQPCRRSRLEMVSLGCGSILVLLLLPGAFRGRPRFTLPDVGFLFFLWAALYAWIMRHSLSRDLARYSQPLESK